MRVNYTDRMAILFATLAITFQINNVNADTRTPPSGIKHVEPKPLSIDVPAPPEQPGSSHQIPPIAQHADRPPQENNERILAMFDRITTGWTVLDDYETYMKITSRPYQLAQGKIFCGRTNVHINLTRDANPENVFPVSQERVYAIKRTESDACDTLGDHEFFSAAFDGNTKFPSLELASDIAKYAIRMDESGLIDYSSEEARSCWLNQHEELVIRGDVEPGSRGGWQARICRGDKNRIRWLHHTPSQAQAFCHHSWPTANRQLRLATKAIDHME